MKTRIFVLAVLMFSSCDVLFDDFPRFKPEQESVAIVLKTTYVSHSPNELRYTSDVQIIDSFLSVDNTYAGDLNFSPVGTGTATITEKTIQAVTHTSDSEIVLLLDASSGVEITDPHNIRSQMINKFVDDLGGPSRLTIGAYSRDGLLDSQPIEYITQRSNLVNEEFLKRLFGLVLRTGGSNNFYEAVNNAIDNFPQSTETRNLVVIVQSAVEESVVSMNSLITNANAKNVRINIIGLGNGFLVDDMARVSQSTGGFYAQCSNANQMALVFNNLDRILNGRADAVKVSIRVQPGASAFYSGMEVLHVVGVQDTYLNYTYNEFHTYLRVP